MKPAATLVKSTAYGASLLAVGAFCLQPLFAKQTPLSHSMTVDKTPPIREGALGGYASIVERVAPSIVSIASSKAVPQMASIDPRLLPFLGIPDQPQNQPSQQGVGSGVILTADGYIVTNNHVVEGADEILVSLSGNKSPFEAKVVGRDPDSDIAVLKIDAENLPTIDAADSSMLKVGDTVLAMGSPFGLSETVTTGIVSALGRNDVAIASYENFIQTDASINPGNSGGALVDMKGELIGINSAIFSKGGGSNGIGFAIPANLVKVFLAAAERGDKSFERPYIGAAFDVVTSDVAEAIGLKRAGGALVSKVFKGSPAEAAGLAPGDAVLEMNGHPVEHPDALGYRMLTAGLGTEAKLTVYRNGKEREVSIKLDRAPETVARDETLIEGRNPFSGTTVVNLSPRMADDLRMPPQSTGVAVEKVKPGSPADNIGFQPKDIILSVNGTKITDTSVMAEVAKQDPNLWRVEIDRNGQRIQQFFR